MDVKSQKLIVWLALLVSRGNPLSLSELLNRESYSFPKGIQLQDGQEFDYIVVGAGAGGTAAASRLAVAGYHVLLVEAGGNPSKFTRVPGLSMALMGSDIDWQYKTLSNNKSCLSCVDQQCRFSRGKCLGGSTSINYMIYTRGNKKDYDELGDGWRYDDLLPYFLRFEGLQDLHKLPPSSRTYHSTDGPMRIGFFDKTSNPWHSRLISAFKSLEFPFNPDVNAKSQIGVTQVIGYVYRGKRMSTARGYLTRDDVKKTLKVAKHTMCTGVILDQNKIAQGITVVQGAQKFKLYARKEVVLSAGTIGTPQILMMSGIGPADHLKSMGIPVQIDLPVGSNMKDHVLPLLMLLVPQPWGPLGKLEVVTSKVPQLIDLLVANEGELTTVGLTDVNVFANSHCYNFKRRRLLNQSIDGSDCSVPNLQITFSYMERKLLSLAKRQFQHVTELNDDVSEQISEANKDYGIVLISPILLNPKSEGSVRLASKDPLKPPAIYPNYLGDERDLEEIVRSIGIIEHIVETDVLRQYNVSLFRLKLTGCPEYKRGRRLYWRCFIRQLTHSVYHATGTVAMNSVVDPQLRVLGAQRLRVADLSVVPRPPRANTEAVTVAIGERVVDFLLDSN